SAAQRLVVGYRHVRQVQRALVEDGAACTQTAAAQTAVAALGQAAFDSHVVHRQTSWRQFHPARYVKQSEIRRVVGRIGVAGDGGAVAVDDDGTVDSWQARRAIPEIVYCLQRVSGACLQIDDGSIVGRVGRRL